MLRRKPLSDTTKIEWAEHTGGPYFGCDKVSPGRAHCYAEALATSRLEPLFRRAYKTAGFDDLEHGGIIGSVDVVDCVATSESRWFGGLFGFVLRDPQPLPFQPCKGRLGFFDLPSP